MTFTWKGGTITVAHNGIVQIDPSDDHYAGDLTVADGRDLATAIRWCRASTERTFPKLHSQVTHRGWFHNNDKKIQGWGE